MNDMSNLPNTAELQKEDSAHFMHPFSMRSALKAEGARIITEGKGLWLTNSDGETFIDAMAGLWCVNIGYGRQELVDVAAKQMEQLSYYSTFVDNSNIPVIKLAKRLAEIAPGSLNNVFFSNSGSEANDTNIRLVRHYWATKGKPEKNIIIGRNNAYHGSTIGSASLGGMGWMHAQGGMPIPNVEHIGQPNWYEEGGDMDPQEFGRMRARELEEKILELGEDRVAAFIAEPVQGAGGAIVPPESYWPEVKRILDKYDILFILDEVVSGYGRFGEWFACQALDLQPDILTTAKGLSSGYIPIGASIVSDEIAQTIADMPFAHGYTYSGHPVAAALALENLRLIEEEGMIDNVRDVAAPYMKEQWGKLTDHPLVGEANMMGLMGSMVLTPDKEKRAAFADEYGAAGEAVHKCALKHGLVFRNLGNRIVIAPSLCITKEEIDTIVERTRKALDDAYAELKENNLLVAAE